MIAILNSILMGAYRFVFCRVYHLKLNHSGMAIVFAEAIPEVAEANSDIPGGASCFDLGYSEH